MVHFVLRELAHFFREFERTLRDPEVEGLLVLVVGLLGVGTVFFHFVEGWGWLDSVYFGVVSLTTVGYGDLTPHTSLGKIGAMVYLLTGIGLFLAFVNKVSGDTLRHHLALKEKNASNKSKPLLESSNQSKPH